MQEPRLGVAAALAACFFLSATFIWLRLDRTPPSWDDGYYLTKSLELYDTLGERGVGCSWTLVDSMGSEPAATTARLGSPAKTAS